MAGGGASPRPGLGAPTMAPATVERIDRLEVGPARDLPEVQVIPFDHVAQFDLTGQVGRLVQDVISVGVEGVFVALSIGYGLDEEPAEPIQLLPLPSGAEAAETLDQVTLGDLPGDSLIDGFRLDPALRAIATEIDGVTGRTRLRGDLRLSAVPGLFQRLRRTEELGFLLSMVDTATGRELQNKPVWSVATLGAADGRRPFKRLAQPMVFMPRSTIRFQVEERTAGARGRLFVTLQGYKVLAQAGRLEEAVRRLAAFDPRAEAPVYDAELGDYRRRGAVREGDLPDPDLVPFDYVAAIELEGRPGNLIEEEVPVTIDGGFLVTALGYGFDPQGEPVELLTAGDPLDLGKVPVADLRPVEALFDGLRLHPARVRLAFEAGGRLARPPRTVASRLFQSANRAERLSFLFSVTDSGTGRELQSRRVHNVAGLGTASGARPFKALHRPLALLPRSTLRVKVEERVGRGRLHIVFQGFKILRSVSEGRGAA